MTCVAERSAVYSGLALADGFADQGLHRGDGLGGLGGPAPLACGGGVGDGLQVAQGVGGAELVIRAGVAVVGRPGVVHGDTGEGGQHAHRLDRLPAAPGVDHEQGVFAGAGAVHPVQLSVHPEAGFVEPGDVAGGDLPAGMLQEPVKLARCSAGDRRDGPGGNRDAEQLGQRLRGALLRQELPGIEVDDDRGDPRPVAGRGVRARRGGGPGALPAAALPLDQLVLGHLHARGGRSKTWRRSTDVTGRPARPAPQPQQAAGSCRTSRSGRATRS